MKVTYEGTKEWIDYIKKQEIECHMVNCDVRTCNGNEECEHRKNLEVVYIEKRWRAVYGGLFYYVTPCGLVTKSFDFRTVYDNDFYDVGNYYETEEICEKVAEQANKAFVEEAK